MIDIRHPLNICRASAGTGKTYTLAAYYVGLLLSGEDYRSILAITFTNNATAEMSERILSYLYGISQGTERAFLLRARDFMVRDAQASDAELARRAGECFRKMLLDYDNVQVMTIDSFLQTLLAGLAGVLQVNAGLSLELDIDPVIRKAVDQLLTTDMTPADRAIIENYMQAKLDEESHWDVRQGLCALAKELYNESVQMLDADNKILFDATAIARRREALKQLFDHSEDLEALQKLLAQCDPTNYNRYTLAAYERLRRSVVAPQKMSAADRFRGVSEKSCNAPEMAQATELAARVGHLYNTVQLSIFFSRDMELMASLQRLIRRNLTDANSALLAQTASTLTKALRAGDADFILEKAGIRYRHILMDEFQDTSKLQWSVIEQLVQDVLAGEGHTMLIVGDIKQSIYRWRNGDWHIMASLGAEDSVYAPMVNRAFENLTRNYRSSEEVVRFNLSLFDHIIAHYPYPEEAELIEAIYGEGFVPEKIEHFYQADKKKGGFVRFKAFPKGTKEDLATDMFDQIAAMLDKGARLSDMMILVREKKEAALICSMSPYPIVSADSFLLDASEAVRMVIAGLKVVAKNDEVSAQWLEWLKGDPMIAETIRAAVNRRMPLYEAVSELVRILLTDETGQYQGTETAYINNLLDRTRAYVSAYGSHWDDFLSYWDDTMHSKSIPATATEAIRIMTVHASKGLQAQTLFVPFCMWPKEAGRHAEKIWCEMAAELQSGEDYVPIRDGNEMADSAYASEHEAEHLNMRIDNLNMLYVALTRAEDNLFVSTSYPVTSKGAMGTCNHVGRYIMDFLEQDEYEVGELVIKNTGMTESRDTESLSAELWANSEQVRFVQSQEGALYTDYGEESYRRVARMEEGTLCHEIFAHLRKADELEAVLDMFETRGEIKDKTQRDELKTLISSAWQGNEQMRDWFTAPWELRLEEAIYIDHRELRPDRVMINPLTNEAIVLDYKFGQWNEHYKQQVSEYMEALRRMGYQAVRGYLWYARKNKLVEVK